MADYRCPNCGGYSRCRDDCPTGGKDAVWARDIEHRIEEANELKRQFNAIRGLPRNLGIVRDD